MDIVLKNIPHETRNFIFRLGYYFPMKGLTFEDVWKQRDIEQDQLNEQRAIAYDDKFNTVQGAK
jgi:hypothetical protein